LHDSLNSLAVRLSTEDVERIERIGAQIAGMRYDPAQMQMLDSEK